MLTRRVYRHAVATLQGEYGSSGIQAYMAIWHDIGVSQLGGASLKPLLKPEVFELSAAFALEPQLVLTLYAVTSHDSDGEGAVLVGQLHIRVPVGTRSPSIVTKQRVVREALLRITDAANSCVFSQLSRCLSEM